VLELPLKAQLPRQKLVQSLNYYETGYYEPYYQDSNGNYVRNIVKLVPLKNGDTVSLRHQNSIINSVGFNIGISKETKLWKLNILSIISLNNVLKHRRYQAHYGRRVYDENLNLTSPFTSTPFGGYDLPSIHQRTSYIYKPSLSGEIGLVFKMGESLSLIPKLNAIFSLDRTTSFYNSTIPESQVFNIDLNTSFLLAYSF